MPPLAACAGQPLAPEPVPLDRVACARCGMIVSRLDQAAQAAYADDDPRFYDDVGCLATDREAARGEYRFWVYTAEGGWVDADAAWFVIDGAVQTPMGYGITALSEADTPERFAAAMTWAELVDLLENRP